MSSSQPNILFFFTDDQRFDTIGALGNTVSQTPNIDRLVSMGTAFTHAHIPGGSSPAVCMPSRAMLHTGRSLFHLTGSGQSVAEDHTLLGEHLRACGYETFGTGKWHNGLTAFNRSFTGGDEIFFGGMVDHWNVPAHRYDPTCTYNNHILRCTSPGTSKETVALHGDHLTGGYHSSEMVCDAAIRFLREGSQTDNPFFAYVSFLAPHDPRVMPQKFRDLYNPADIDLPPNFLGGHPFNIGSLQIRDELLARFPRDPDETREHLADYYGMISHLDYQLGRVLETLEGTGQLDNTIIIFAGDNGLALGQHGLFGKQNLYDHSVRVPLIMAGPGIPAGKTTDAFAYLLDIFPTLCELTGNSIPDSVEGRSLVSALQGQDAIREYLFSAYMGCQRAIRNRQYKLIEYVIDGSHTMTQLFDLQNDPWETRNLASEADQQARVSEMRQLLRTTAESWDDAKSPWGQEFWSGYDS